VAISQVQAKSTTYTGGLATQTLLYTPIAAGNLVEVYAGNTGGGGTLTCSAPGWTFQTPTTVTNYQGNVLYVFPAYNVPSGAITITCVSTAGGSTDFNVIEWSGVATSAARVQANSNQNVNVNAAVTLPGTTSGNLITFATSCIYNNPTAAICSSGSVSGGINNTDIGLLRSGDWQVGAGGSLTGTEQDAGGGAGATTMIMSEYLAAGGGASFVADDFSSLVSSVSADSGLYLPQSSQDLHVAAASAVDESSSSPIIWMPPDSTAWTASPQMEFAPSAGPIDESSSSPPLWVPADSTLSVLSYRDEFAPSYLSDDVSGSAVPLPVDAPAATPSGEEYPPQIPIGDDASTAIVGLGPDQPIGFVEPDDELIITGLDDGSAAPIPSTEAQATMALSSSVEELTTTVAIDDVSGATVAALSPDVVLLASPDDELSVPGTPDEASPSFRPPEVVEDVRPRPSPEEFATTATFSLDDISTGSPSPTFLDPTILVGASEEIKGLAAIVDEDARAIAQTDSPATSTLISSSDELAEVFVDESTSAIQTSDAAFPMALPSTAEEHVVVVLDEASASLPVLDGPVPSIISASSEDVSRTFVGDDASTGVSSAEAFQARILAQSDEFGHPVAFGLDDSQSPLWPWTFDQWQTALSSTPEEFFRLVATGINMPGVICRTVPSISVTCTTVPPISVTCQTEGFAPSLI
jgi:hypothetical protein